MSEESTQKKSKGQKKKDKLKKKKEDSEDQPKSKFFVQEEEGEEDDPQPQPTIKSKFVLPNDSDEEEPAEKDIKNEEEPKPDAPKSKFFTPMEDEEPEESPKNESKPALEAPQSKFLPSPETESPEESKAAPSKKKANKKKNKEEPKNEQNIADKPAAASKFFVQEDEEKEENEEEAAGKTKEENNQEKSEQLEKNEEEKTDAKKDKKKAKKAAKKEEKKTGGAPTAAVPEKKDDKKGKKLGGAAKLAQERMARLKEEEDRLKREEEERLRIEEELRRKEEEEERIKKEIEQKKREEKEAKIKKLKDEGKYMSKKDRIKYEQDKIKREQLEKLGLIPSEIVKGEETQPAAVQEVAPPAKPSEQKKKFKKKNELQELEEKLKQKEMLGLPLNPIETSKPINEEILDDWTKLDESQPTQPATNAEEVKTEEQANKEEKDEKKGKKEKKLPKKEKNEKSPKPEKQEEKPIPEPLELLSPQPELRSPICCILGHVDTGKTTILDKIRNTNVQEGEAGGITQQIGATFFPSNKLELEIAKLKSFYSIDCQVPGLLIIDTPGHESFSNLRSRGSSLCDIAILVIDLMHGLEKQTLESLELLKMRKTPFIIALNKIDRNYEWKTMKNASSYISLEKQSKNTQNEFYKRLDGVKLELAEKGFNSALFWENPDVSSYVSLVPTSGVTGEGLPDLLGVILKYSSKFLKQKIKMRGDVFDCTILEVKMIEGLGTTIDVILVNGTLKEGDRIILMGFNGPIITNIRALLTPHPMKEMRVKGEYVHHKIIHASMGVKISANELENAVAGSHLHVIHNEEEIKPLKRELEADFENIRKKIKLVNQGVCVAASTLGSLEALLQFLETSKIPVSHIGIGPVSKEDVTKSLKSILADDEKKKKKEFATVLAFDVKILPEAQKYADENGIKIFTANIIYHLFDQFMAYVNQIREERKKEEGKDAVFPCVLKPVMFFNKKDPIIMGVDVVRGILRPGAPICLYDATKLKLGVVESIEINKKNLREAKPSNGSVAIRISGDSSITAERHFDMKSIFVSMISRHSLDVLKEYFRDEMAKEDWDLARDLKPFFNIP